MPTMVFPGQLTSRYWYAMVVFAMGNLMRLYNELFALIGWVVFNTYSGL